MTGIDGVRLVRGLALAIWALFLGWLWLSGRATTYAAPRTVWVVTFGAVALAVTAAAVLAGVRRPGPSRRPAPRELVLMTALIAPVLAAFSMPTPMLGALAVKQKTVEARVNPTFRDEKYRSTLYAIAGASGEPEAAAAYGVRPGASADVDGFVSGREGGGLQVSRFFATCCAADAVPYTIQVITPPGAAAYPDDTWVRVRGTLREYDGGFAIEATAIDEVDQPSDPYS